MPPNETRQRILDAAEELFAEHGIGETSLRALTRHADVNLAAVHYHFGSKDGLLDAVIERRAEPINTARMAALDDLLASRRAPTAEAILKAFFAPVIALIAELERDGRRATQGRLIARIEAEPPDDLRALAERHFGAVGRRFVSVLCDALPELGPSEVLERFRYAHAVLNALFSDVFVWNEEPAERFEGLSTAARAEQALAFATAGLRAPSARQGESMPPRAEALKAVVG